MRFNAPPGWSVPAPDWLPDAGWTPDPSWPPAPPGWEFFVDDAEPAAAKYPLLSPNPAAPAGGPASHGPVVVAAAGAAVLVVALLGFFLVRFAVSKSDDGVSRVAGSPENASQNWTVEPSAQQISPGHTAAAQDRSHTSAGAGAITFEGMRDFVYRHYADLPADPRATWDRLDGHFTARLAWSDYAGFWATIRSVSVTSVQPDGPDSVIARLALVPHRGNASTEQRRIKFVSTGGVLQIYASDRLG